LLGAFLLAEGNFLIGTDIGTFGTKSVLVNAEGRILADSFEETDIISLRPLWAEQWPQVWLESVCNTIRSVISKSKIDRSEIGGLSISGLYSGSGVPCDENMNPIRPCLIWMDRRAVEEVEWAKKNIGVAPTDSRERSASTTPQLETMGESSVFTRETGRRK
jgi:xylulokinase